MNRFLIFLFLAALAAGGYTSAQTPYVAPNSGSTRAALNAALRHTPRLQYNPEMPADSFGAWRQQMSDAMARLMHHPDAPWKGEELVSEHKREGYTVQRWRSWPLADGPVHYLVLVPDTPREGAPAALCIPGFGQTKELLAGERPGNYALEGEPEAELSKNAMALHYVRDGMVAVAVDNPSFGELSDNGFNDFLASSRMLLELDWSYLGLASWQDRVVLEAMKRHKSVDPENIIASGFSLGTEPLMVLGLLDNSIRAFVYNDFLCRTRERVLVMDTQTTNGDRPLPNSIEHLIPGFLKEFDFPDIVAALAPRPVICTEGGLDRDFLIIKGAFAKAGAPEAFTYHHYPKFAEETSRAMAPTDTMPQGITRDTFFRLANVDPPSHYFKSHLVLPWLRKL